jgi:hypothetical protein
LLLINGEWGLARSAAFAQRLQREIAGSDDSKVRHAYRLAYARDPSAAELSRGVEFLSPDGDFEGSDDAPPAALVDFCHVVLNSSEFLYVD